MTHNSSGLTITFPPFDPNTDKLFQAIRSFIEIKHEDVERRLQRIETRQQKILTTMGTMEQLMTAAINAAAAAAATAATLNRVAGGLTSTPSNACIPRTNCAPSRINVVEPVRVLPSPHLVATSAFDTASMSTLTSSCASKPRPAPGATTASASIEQLATGLNSMADSTKTEPTTRFTTTSPERHINTDFDFNDPNGMGVANLYNVLRSTAAAHNEANRAATEAHKAQRSHYSSVRSIFPVSNVADDAAAGQALALSEEGRRGNSKTSIVPNGEASGLSRTDATNSIIGDIANLPPLQTSSIGTQMRVIFDREDKRYIWLGGHQSVRLPLWAYVKCLETTRGMPDELGPRISLRMLQALFGKQYMLTHNYSGTNGKAPIDRDVLNAVLDQALLQFGSDHFYKDATCLSKFRDYINNAFRVVAYRDRKGVSVTCPFWDTNGQPMTEFFLLRSADLIRRLRLDQYDALGTTLPLPADDEVSPPAYKRARSEPAGDLYTAVSFPVTTIDSFSVRETEESPPVSLEDSEPEPGSAGTGSGSGGDRQGAAAVENNDLSDNVSDSNCRSST